MKPSLLAAVAVSILLALPLQAETKKPAKRGKKSSALPPKSPMIVLPPASDAPADAEPPKLISSEMSGRDLQFFTTAVEAGRHQAYLVGLLQARAESERIKAVGTALASTQEEENKQIGKLAALKGWSVPSETTAAQKKVGADLEKLSGGEFDKAVMDQVIEASRKSVSAYESAAQSTDPEIRNFAQQMLPLAQEKVQLAERMTGAGKAASQLFRTGAPAKNPAANPERNGPAPKPGSPQKPKALATPTSTPAPPTPSGKPTAAKVQTSVVAPVSDTAPAVPSQPRPIPPPITD